MLDEAQRQVKNKQEKVEEQNVKAADADTQARRCDQTMIRRRRTCSCDDLKLAGQGGEEMLGEGAFGGFKVPFLIPLDVSHNGTRTKRSRTSRRLLTKARAKTRAKAQGHNYIAPVLTSALSALPLSTKFVKNGLKSVGKAVSGTRFAQALGFGDDEIGKKKEISRSKNTNEFNVKSERKEAGMMPERNAKLTRRRGDNWERRRFVRRRAEPQTAAMRRRRYAFPETPQAHIPSSVCPCPPKKEPAGIDPSGLPSPIGSGREDDQLEQLKQEAIALLQLALET